MARRKKGVGLFRIIVLILLVVLIALVLVLLLKKKGNLENKPEEIKTSETQDNLNEEVRISCNKYDVYFDDDNKLGFNFIVAELSFVNNNGSLYYDLKNLTTSEKIKLNDVDYYIDKIKSYNYDISNFNLLSTEFTSEGGSLNGNVLIPFLKNYTEISIFNGEEIKFDLTKNKHNINELFYEVKTEDIKTDKYDISVSNSYLENSFHTSDTNEEFPVPLALVFELKVNELSSNNVHVETATFVPEGASAGGSIECLDDHIDALKIENIVNKNLKVGDKYGLFFQISEQTKTQGKIMIKLSDSDKWIELSTGE